MMNIHFTKQKKKNSKKKKGQHRGSKSHSDLYTDENPKGTIKGLKFTQMRRRRKKISK